MTNVLLFVDLSLGDIKAWFLYVIILFYLFLTEDESAVKVFCYPYVLLFNTTCFGWVTIFFEQMEHLWIKIDINKEFSK